MRLVAFLIFTFCTAYSDDIIGISNLIGSLVDNYVEFPYRVSVQYAYINQHICGGIIIDNRHVLTAALCFTGQDAGPQPDHFQVVAVIGNTTEHPRTEVKRRVQKIFIHEHFIQRILLNNIAVLRLTEPFPEGTANIKAVRLPTDAYQSEKMCNYSGWRPDKASFNLRYKSVQFAASNACLSSCNEELAVTLLCANETTLFDDLSSAMVCDNTIVAMHSYIYLIHNYCPEMETSASYYLNIYHFNEWIQEKMAGTGRTLVPVSLIFVFIFAVLLSCI